MSARRLSASCVGAMMLADPLRIFLTYGLLAYARKRMPDMFDPVVAAENVRLRLLDADAYVDPRTVASAPLARRSPRVAA